MDAERIFARYGAVMLRHAQLILGSGAQAEDAVQDALVRILRLNPSLTDERHELAWVLAVTGNICRDMLRKQKRRREVSMPDWFDAPDASGGPEEEAEQRERDRKLVRAVMELPEKYREAVLMVYYHELTGSQAADALGITAAAFRSRQMRARDMLKWMLGEEVEL